MLGLAARGCCVHALALRSDHSSQRSSVAILEQVCPRCHSPCYRHSSRSQAPRRTCASILYISLPALTHLSLCTSTKSSSLRRPSTLDSTRPDRSDHLSDIFTQTRSLRQSNATFRQCSAQNSLPSACFDSLWVCVPTRRQRKVLLEIYRLFQGFVSLTRARWKGTLDISWCFPHRGF